jgi:hypothetical protein
MFALVEQIQQQYGISIGTASFLYTLGYIPNATNFPKSTPIEDIVSIVQKEENLSPDEAQLLVRWDRGDIHRTCAVEVSVKV